MDNPDIKTILELLKTILDAIDAMMDSLEDNTTMVIGLGVAGGIVVIIILQTFILMKFIRDTQEHNVQQESVPEKSSLLSGQDMRSAVSAAVSEAVEMSIRNTMGRAAVSTRERSDTNPRLSRGAQFTGKVLALQSGSSQEYN